VNSILPDASGNLVVSMRDTSAVYDINHSTGAVIWTLGGKSPRFKMGPSTSSWGQHDAIPQPDGTITMFDDGGGPPQVHPYSRGLRVRIDTRHLTATLVREYDHTPPISANFEGSAQVLPTGNVFLGWGQQPYFSEDTAAGQQIFDAHFNVPTSTYRAYRFPWSSQPLTAPSLAVSPNSDGSLSLYASWNGATDVAAWQVLAGSSPAALAPVGRSRKRGFETDVMLHTVAPYLAVRALGASDQVLASSPAKATPAHIALYGRSVFVARTGFAGVPASCFARHRCHIAATVSAGRTVIARSGREAIAPNSAGVVYFQLSSTGQRLLRGARSRRLAVRIDLADASGPTAGANFNLVPFSTAGRGPRRGVTQTGGLRLLGLTDFVSADGVGGILAYCPQSSSCLARTTISAGRTALARTGAEFLGPGEAGYLTFSLTSAGRRLLAGAAGNQLGAHVSLSGTGAPTDAQVGLVGFS